MPVVAVTAQVIERDGVVDALELLERAASEVLAKAPGLCARVDRLSVVGVLSPTVPAPAATLASRLGLDPRACETTIGGNTPQWLVTRAAEDVAAGRLAASLIVGAEAMRSAKLGGSAPAVDSAW